MKSVLHTLFLGKYSVLTEGILWQHTAHVTSADSYLLNVELDALSGLLTVPRLHTDSEVRGNFAGKRGRTLHRSARKGGR